MSEQVLFERLAKGVIDGDLAAVETTAKEVIKANMSPAMAIQEGLSKGIKKVGEDFGNGIAFLPDLMMSAEAMQRGMQILVAEIKKRGGDAVKVFSAKAILGTVAGDVHSIGKTLVGAMMTTAGIEVVDLGEDVPVEVFTRKATELKPDIIGLSALLTTTMVQQREVIEALKREGHREKFKVMIGGAPVDEAWAREIGADAYGTDAMDAVAKAKKFVVQKQPS